jgi:hypothetical protein
MRFILSQKSVFVSVVFGTYVNISRVYFQLLTLFRQVNKTPMSKQHPVLSSTLRNTKINLTHDTVQKCRMLYGMRIYNSHGVLCMIRTE